MDYRLYNIINFNIAAIAEYMRNQMGDPSTLITSSKSYKKFQSKEKITVIGYLGDDQSKFDMYIRIG